MEGAARTSGESEVYLGVGARNLLVGFFVLVTLVLPRPVPFDMRAVTAALIGFAGIIALMMVLARHPGLRARPAVVVGAIALDHLTAGLAIVATQDPASTVFLTILVIMTFQVQTLRQRRWTVVSWAAGVTAYVVANAALAVPAEALIARAWVFAGAAAAILLMQQYLVIELTARQRSADLLASLARVAAEAPDLPAGLEVAEPTVRALTGAGAVALVPLHGPAGRAEDGRDGVLLDLGRSSTGPVGLRLEQPTDEGHLDSIRNLLVPLADRDRHLAELRAVAATDPLTGIPNRGTIAPVADRWDAPVLSVIIIDLDHFKALNDTYGHRAGDEVLQRFAALLHAEVRAPDHVARYGGEEFCVLAGTPAPGALTMVERIRARWRASGETLTFSAGVADARGPVDLGALTDRADAALYEAKALGRDRTVIAPDEPGAPDAPGTADVPDVSDTSGPTAEIA